MSGRRGEFAGLQTRHWHILLAVVRRFIIQGEPVGSRALTNDPGCDVSAATVRKILGELTSLGYLLQPHTSAGRVPTEKAYRFYVDALRLGGARPDTQTPAVDAVFSEPCEGVQPLLERTSTLLARLSNGVGVVVAPSFGDTLLHRLKFVRVDGRHVLVILTDEHGLSCHRFVSAAEDYSQQELDRIAEYLVSCYQSLTLREVREAVAREYKAERVRLEGLTAAALALASRSLEQALEPSAVYMDGTSRLLNAPECARIDTLQSLLAALEAKDRVVLLLDDCIAGDEGVQVIIGSETGMQDMPEFSVVAARYGLGERVVGSLGVLGPRRMEYDRVLAVVDQVARRVTQALAQADAW